MAMMRFSPNFIGTLVVKPIRYFFTYYAGPDLKYDIDPKLSKIEIGAMNDFNKIAFQEKPRVLVDRGGFIVDHVGITDNMAQGSIINQTRGLDNRVNMALIRGAVAVTIEARNEGVCELITDMISHFLVWTAPLICDSQGFKTFAFPLVVSNCTIMKDDTEIFQTNISVPYVMEEIWNVDQDAMKLKEYFFTLSS